LPWIKEALQMTVPPPTHTHRGLMIGLALTAGLVAVAGAQEAEIDAKYLVEDYVPEFSEAEIASRLEKTGAEITRWTGEVPLWAKGVHPVTTADWFLDAEGTVDGGRVLPGAPLFPVVDDEGEQFRQDGRIKVRLTGWQLEEVPRVLYAEAGARVLLATLGPEAQEARVTGDAVTLPATGQTWMPVEVTGWLATDDLIAHTKALWDHANALFTANCAQCHAAPHLDEFDANAWSGQFDAMVDQTTLLKEEQRLVKTYLQLHAAPVPTEGSGVGLALGELVYQQLCLSCHGDDASEGSGGDIRGSDFRTVRNAVGGYETMPEVVLAPSEMQAVADYLTHLKDGS
jgi:mono/diheme cytochrome c family protein